MTPRRLAAILAADVVGFSALMAADESTTIARLRTLRATTIDPAMTTHGGRIFKTTGDGLLAEFPSAVDALRCALAIQTKQRDTENTLPLRIGLHSGDVVIDGDDLLGDGINIAARLEPLAAPHGIALSARIREDITGKIAIDLEDLGEPPLKNLTQKIRVYRVLFNTPERPTLALPDKPSLVVLPFQNMSGDPEQEYFVDGLVEDITTALSCIRSLFVIARNSAFTYKGRAVDVKQVGRDLGVRYVLEGSVRKAANRVRVTGQLIDTSTGAHLWANRFDGALDDVFDLQDQITSSVAGAIEPTLQHAEIERVQRKPTGDLTAYDYFMRGMALFTPAEWAAAKAAFTQAYTLDPDYGAAYALAAMCVYLQKNFAPVPPTAAEISEGVRLARAAAVKGTLDATALTYAGAALMYLANDVDSGLRLTERACVLNPNSARAWARNGWNNVYGGNPEVAIANFERAIRLSPVDPHTNGHFAGIARAHFNAARYDDAIEWSERSLSARPDGMVAHRVRVAAYAQAGRLDEARRAVADLLADEPEMRLSRLNAMRGPWRRSDDFDRFVDGLRLAGLPE